MSSDRSAANFADQLEAAVARAGNPCLVGLDPHLAALPEEYACARDPLAPRSERASAIADFACSLIEVVAGRVAAVKPQSAFFEVFGADGAFAWERVVRAAHAADLLVIGDVKRGDIDSTARAYAHAFLDGPDGTERARQPAAAEASSAAATSDVARHAGTRRSKATGGPKGIGGADATDTRSSSGSAGTRAASSSASIGARDEDILCDAITVNPFLGADTIQPFLDACRSSGKGIYVLVRTSNKGSALFQEHGDPKLFERIADTVVSAGREHMGESGLSSIGAVIGATHPQELALLRARMPTTPFLLPGYGAQGAGAKDIAAGFLPRGRGALVNSSRGISFAYRQPEYRGVHWKDAARRALDAMIREVNAVVPSA